MPHMEIEQDVRYEDGKIIASYSISEMAIKALNDKLEDELFERIAAKRGYSKYPEIECGDCMYYYHGYCYRIGKTNGVFPVVSDGYCK